MFKDKVLEILEENRGNEISGVDIAGKLGVTRAAVCKAVKQLRRSGNAIISRNNGGYTLEENSARPCRDRTTTRRAYPTR